MPVRIVAIDVDGPVDDLAADRFVMDLIDAGRRRMARKARHRDLDVSWWVAEDDRTDRSDCDSAVFVIPGQQAAARDVLRLTGHAYAHDGTDPAARRDALAGLLESARFVVEAEEDEELDYTIIAGAILDGLARHLATLGIIVGGPGLETVDAEPVALDR